MTPLDFALSYIARGWNPVPIPHRAKKPLDDNWQHRLIDAESAPHFFNGGETQNIGVMLGPTSHGLTDVDLDCAEAIAIAPYILPRTKAIFGRASKRNSHRLYGTDLAITTDAAALQLRDPKTKSMILELRIGGGGKGAQTIFPGSTHEEGEPINWEEDGEPASVDGEDLRQRTRAVAAYSLLARYWPDKGGRHEAARIIGGLLSRHGVEPERIKVIAEAIARAANDPEWRDRRDTARDAAIAHRNGKNAYGLNALRDMFGTDIADKVADWLDYRGGDAPASGTEDLSGFEPEAPLTGLGEWDAGDDIAIPPPRGWLLGNIFARKFMSSLLADGGVGKTALRYAQLLSCAIGRSLTSDHVFQRCRVLIISLEDDADELRRRILALMLHYKVERSELKGWLFLCAPGASGGKLMTTDKAGRLTRGQLADKLETVITARKIDLVSIDPFVKSHSVEENSNSAVDDVVQVLTDLATKYDIAVDAPHHTAKGAADPGNADRGRGASAMKNGARLVYTLAPMTTEEAQAFGIKDEDRRLLIRMDSAKVNIAPPLRTAKWFRLVGIPLGNATAIYPNGDEVQAVEPWTPPDTWAGLSHHLLNQILTAIDAGMPDGNRYSDAPSVKDRAAWKVIPEHAPDRTEAQAREIIKAWVKNGVLVPIDYENPVTRKQVKGLKLDTTKRPS